MPCWNIYILLFSLNLTPNLWSLWIFNIRQQIIILELITGKNDILKYITTENDWNGYLKQL